MRSLFQASAQLSSLGLLIPRKQLGNPDMRELGRKGSFQHSLCSLFLFPVSWSAFLNRVVFVSYSFLSAFCPSALLPNGFLHHITSIFTTEYIQWEWIAECTVVMWKNLEGSCSGVFLWSWEKFLVKVRRRGRLKSLRTCHKSCVFMCMKSRFISLYWTGQGTGKRMVHEIIPGVPLFGPLLFFAVDLIMNSGGFHL